MIITFNKRELLDFANWNINQSRLPRLFCIDLFDNGNLEQIFKIIKSLCPEMTINIENLTNCYIHVNLTFKEPSNFKRVFIQKNKKDNFSEIDFEVLKSGFAFENFDELSNEDLNLWLKLEKNIYEPLIEDLNRNKNNMNTIGVVTDILSESGISYERENGLGFDEEKSFDQSSPMGLSLVCIPNYKDRVHTFQFNKHGAYLGKVNNSKAFIYKSEIA